MLNVKDVTIHGLFIFLISVAYTRTIRPYEKESNSWKHKEMMWICRGSIKWLPSSGTATDRVVLTCLSTADDLRFLLPS